MKKLFLMMSLLVTTHSFAGGGGLGESVTLYTCDNNVSVYWQSGSLHLAAPAVGYNIASAWKQNQDGTYQLTFMREIMDGGDVVSHKVVGVMKDFNADSSAGSVGHVTLAKQKNILRCLRTNEAL